MRRIVGIGKEGWVGADGPHARGCVGEWNWEGRIERGRLPAWIRGGADGPPRIEEGQTARLG